MRKTTNLPALLYLASFAIAQDLSFVRPRFDDLETNHDGVAQLTAGENVTISWESEFEFTTLTVYQEVETNLFQAEVLAGT